MSSSRALDFARQTLPAPTELYSAERARQTNERIEHLISGRASQDYVQDVFNTFTIPFAKNIGADAAFPVPVGTVPTVVPLDVAVVSDSCLVNGVVQYDLEAQILFSLRHNAGVNSVNIVAAAVYVDNVARITTVGTYNLDTEFDMTGIAVGHLLKDEVLTLRVVHDDNVATTFDLTNSNISILRLSAAPRTVP
jgi:hypothetical protein